MINNVAMRLALFYISASLIVGCTGVEAENQEKINISSDGGVTVAILASEVIEPEMLERIESHVSWQLSCQVIKRYLKSADIDSNTFLDTLADHNDSSALYTVGLFDSGEQKQKAVSRNNKYALVDLSPLGAGIDESADREVYLRRAERSVIAALASMLGMRPCIIPQCVLFPVSDLEGLDEKGRGFCPPCQQRAKNLLSASGIKAGTVDSE